MKKYTTPIIRQYTLRHSDIITSSQQPTGTVTFGVRVDNQPSIDIEL